MAGKRPLLKVFGGNYDTPDGSCIRDYIHITDIGIFSEIFSNWTCKSFGIFE